MKEINDILEQAEEATKGPWAAHDLSDEVYSPPDNTGWWWVWQTSRLPYYGGVAQPTGRKDNDGSLLEMGIDDNRTGVQEKKDAEFVAAARTNVPKLANTVAALLSYADKLDKMPHVRGHSETARDIRTIVEAEMK